MYSSGRTCLAAHANRFRRRDLYKVFMYTLAFLSRRTDG